MQRQQGLDQLEQIGNHSQLFEATRKSDALSKLYASVPDSFLYFDLDVFTEKERPVPAWGHFCDQALEHILRAFRQLKDIITGKV